ncbi:thioesterase domain-containing protein [Acidicapsa ligni]|uniref:thioesterase domain-containing protein n=1 Tax=Acidicapsa ligni TaxID=542300 RepID=UPI0021E06709|nr:non-ribosomal peptide synthetase [Acidicapsa ligni]
MSSFAFIDLNDRSRSDLERTLTGWWQEVLGIEHVHADHDFFSLGGDALLGGRLLAKVKERYGIDLAAPSLFDARTVGRMADLIQLKQASAEDWSIVPIRSQGTRPPLFLIHGVGGNVLGFFGLVKRLQLDQPVYGIQAQALQRNAPTLLQLKDMAAYYIRELRRVQPHGPYRFLGLSFGGLVAYEMAQQLRASGEVVGLLGMLDTWQPSYMRRLPNRGPLHLRIYNRLHLVYLHTRKLGVASKLAYLKNRLKSRWLRMIYSISATRGRVDITSTMKSIRDINLVAAMNYQVLPYEGRVTLFRATGEDDWRLPEDLGWRETAADGVEIFPIPGDHGQVLAEPSVSILAQKLTECLDQSEQRVEIIL